MQWRRLYPAGGLPSPRPPRLCISKISLKNSLEQWRTFLPIGDSISRLTVSVAVDKSTSRGVSLLVVWPVPEMLPRKNSLTGIFSVKNSPGGFLPVNSCRGDFSGAIIIILFASLSNLSRLKGWRGVARRDRQNSTYTVSSSGRTTRQHTAPIVVL